MKNSPENILHEEEHEKSILQRDDFNTMSEDELRLTIEKASMALDDIEGSVTTQEHIIDPIADTAKKIIKSAQAELDKRNNQTKN